MVQTASFLIKGTLILGWWQWADGAKLSKYEHMKSQEKQKEICWENFYSLPFLTHAYALRDQNATHFTNNKLTPKINSK